MGASTNFMIVQGEAYLAQARSTEVAARADWMKAQLSLDRAMGIPLDKNNIVFHEAIRGHVPGKSNYPKTTNVEKAAAPVEW